MLFGLKGRLKWSTLINYCVRSRILLTSGTHLSLLLPLQSHLRIGHPSTQTTLHPLPTLSTPTSPLSAHLPPPHSIPILSICPATPEWCKNALAALKPNCATGPDHLPSPAFLACRAVVISSTLPLACSHFPTPWKCSIVKPLHNSGDHALSEPEEALGSWSGRIV